MGVDKLKSLLTLSPRGAVASRSRKLIFGGALALAALSGCNGNDPNNNNPDGGAGSGGIDGGGGTGAGGGGGSTPSCAGLENEWLAYKSFDVGETGSVTVNKPGDAYDGMSLEVVSADVFDHKDASNNPLPVGVGLENVTYDIAGYETMSGVRPWLVDSAQPFIWNGTSCTPNRAAASAEALADPARQPIVWSPTGQFATGFEVRDNMELMGVYELEAEKTRMQVSGLTALNQDSDVIFCNSKPVPNITGTRDENDLLILDVSPATDEGKAVWDRLNFSFSIPTEPVPGEPWKHRSLSSFLDSSITSTTVGLSQSVVDDTTIETVTIPEKPEITDYVVDCSSSGGNCISAWPTPYPVTFSVSDALNCTPSSQIISGIGTPGTVQDMQLNGTSGYFTWLAGSTGGDIVRVEVKCDGPGGSNSAHEDKYQF